MRDAGSKIAVINVVAWVISALMYGAGYSLFWIPIIIGAILGVSAALEAKLDAIIEMLRRDGRG